MSKHDHQSNLALAELAMQRDLKRNETRSWWTSHRGLLAIHAAKKPFYARDYSAQFVDRVRRDHLLDEPLVYGAVLCIVNLKDCVPTKELAGKLTEAELFYGNYDDGRFAWITDQLVVLPEPIPTVGHQGLFDWNLPGSCSSVDIFGRAAKASPQGAFTWQ